MLHLGRPGLEDLLDLSHLAGLVGLVDRFGLVGPVDRFGLWDPEGLLNPVALEGRWHRQDRVPLGDRLDLQVR